MEKVWQVWTEDENNDRGYIKDQIILFEGTKTNAVKFLHKIQETGEIRNPHIGYEILEDDTDDDPDAYTEML